MRMILPMAFLVYDIRGNKIKMNDPDMGTWTYAYNALGKLISQTDAK
jgi:YD repeat-containing protein